MRKVRFISYLHDGRPDVGALVEREGAARDGGVVELGEHLGGARDLGDVLARGQLDLARRLAHTTVATLSFADIELRPTVPRPGKILCIGVNYGGRNAEYRDGSEEPTRPSVFVRFPSSLVAHGHDLVRPPESEQLDYEGEIVAVVGRAGRRIPTQRAREHLAGLTLGNEGTIRDWVRHAKFNVTQGKNWDGSGSLGPWMVPVDEVGALDGLRLTTVVNGELRQDDTTATMAHPIEELVAYLSTFCTLEPGDLVFTGTPTGAGARLDPPRYLRPGDVVEVTVPEIGTLRNGVRDE